MLINWSNFINESNKVVGYAIVEKGYMPYIHSHPTDEIYNFINGIAKLYINGKIIIVNSPERIFIPKNSYHAMTAITDRVVLVYELNDGPFENIEYNWTTSKL